MTSRTRVVLLSAILGCGAQPVFVLGPGPQAVNRELGAISGLIFDLTLNAPLAAAFVSLVSVGGSERMTRRVLTDSVGRFVFVDLPAGEYQIVASKLGYASVAGSGEAPTDQITLPPGTWLADLRIRLVKQAAISGRVTDERGIPLVGLPVKTFAMTPIAGVLQLAVGPWTTTDDGGRFRIGGLASGKYFVQVPAAPASRHSESGVYPPTFYPGTSDLASSIEIALQAGEQRDDADFVLRPVRAQVVSGRVTGGTDTGGLLVRLRAVGPPTLAAGSLVAAATVDSAGRFRLTDVPHGAYTVDVTGVVSELLVGNATERLQGGPPVIVGFSAGGYRTPVAAAPRGTTLLTRTTNAANASYWGQVDVRVGADPVEDLRIPLSAGSRFRGRYVFESGVRPKGLRLSLESPTGDADQSVVPDVPVAAAASEDSFEIAGVKRGPYFIRPVALNAVVKAIMHRGVDLTDRAVSADASLDDIVITMTEDGASVSGLVRDVQAKSAGRVLVVAFPTNPESWTEYGFTPPRIKATLSSADGRYTLAGLPAGEYCVVAVDSDDMDIWKQPRFFAAAAPSSVRVGLRWGTSLTRDLVVAKVR